MRDIIQIVPVRSRKPEGVGDYARLLARELLDRHDIRTTFIACTPMPEDQRADDGWPTITLDKRGALMLSQALRQAGADRDAPLFVHLSAYGYHPKGVPFWLVSALARWRRQHPAIAMVTVFHELYATGPITGSAFWLGRLQARIARQTQKLSTGRIATTEPYAALLNAWAGDTGARALPVFSTIGEPESVSAISDRQRDLIIFGRAGVHQGIYLDAAQAVGDFVRANGIERIIDIGPRTHAPPAEIAGAPVIVAGTLAPQELQQALGKAMFGLIDYDANRLAKSTVFAAYCAHGVIPVVISDAPGLVDGLEPGRCYVRLSGADAVAPLPDAQLAALQAAARSWYEPHSLAASASLIASLLANAGQPGHRA